MAYLLSVIIIYIKTVPTRFAPKHSFQKDSFVPALIPVQLHLNCGDHQTWRVCKVWPASKHMKTHFRRIIFLLKSVQVQGEMAIRKVTKWPFTALVLSSVLWGKTTLVTMMMMMMITIIIVKVATMSIKAYIWIHILIIIVSITTESIHSHH